MTLVLRRIERGEIDHERWWLLVAGCLVALTLLAHARPERGQLVCPIKAVSGIPCASCGSSRALEAVVRGDLQGAVRLNPLAALGLVALGLWLTQAAVAMALGLPRWRVEWNEADIVTVRWLAVLGVLVNWLYLVLDGR